MIRAFIVVAVLAFSSPVLAHSASKFVRGPHGGHIIDAGGGAQHWELVASGNQLMLYVTDSTEKPVDTKGGSAEAIVLVGGKRQKLEFTPAGENTMKAIGDFKATKGMKVIVKTKGVGGKSFQARLTPLK